MLKQCTRTYVKVATIEKPMATFYVAFAVVECNGKIVRVSNPRLVRIVPKKNLTLAGKTESSSILALFGNTADKSSEESIPSPYVSDFFFVKNTESANLRPRPPTIKG